MLSQPIENQTLRIKHVNIHNAKRGLRTQLEFIYWECNEKPVSSRIKLCPYARFAKIKLCPYAAQAAHERHPGTLCQFPLGNGGPSLARARIFEKMSQCHDSATQIYTMNLHVKTKLASALQAANPYDSKRAQPTNMATRAWELVPF